MNIDKEYSLLVSEMIKYIEEIKGKEKNMPLIDIIIDYCFKNNIEPELMGDAIKNDLYFKSFISKDCEQNKIFSDKSDW